MYIFHILYCISFCISLYRVVQCMCNLTINSFEPQFAKKIRKVTTEVGDASQGLFGKFMGFQWLIHTLLEVLFVPILLG